MQLFAQLSTYLVQPTNRVIQYSIFTVEYVSNNLSFSDHSRYLHEVEFFYQLIYEYLHYQLILNYYEFFELYFEFSTRLQFFQSAAPVQK